MKQKKNLTFLILAQRASRVLNNMCCTWCSVHEGPHVLKPIALQCLFVRFKESFFVLFLCVCTLYMFFESYTK